MTLVAIITEDGELDVFELEKNTDVEEWVKTHYNTNSCNWQVIKRITMHCSIGVG